MQSKSLLLAIFSFLALTISASALECMISAKDKDLVAVWKNLEAQREGNELIRADVHKTNPRLLSRLVSCLANDGDRAVITDIGVFRHSITIIDGQNSGCRGIVSREWCNIKDK